MLSGCPRVLMHCVVCCVLSSLHQDTLHTCAAERLIK